MGHNYTGTSLAEPTSFYYLPCRDLGTIASCGRLAVLDPAMWVISADPFATPFGDSPRVVPHPVFQILRVVSQQVALASPCKQWFLLA